MKRRLSAVLLAAGLAVSVFSTGVLAAETEAETAEQVTEAVSEAAAEESLEQEESELGAETGAETGESEAASDEDPVISLLTSQLAQISAWTDEQIEQLIDGSDLTGAAIAGNWKSVKEELGAFIEVTDAELNAEGTEIVGHARYEKIDEGIDVTVTYSVNPETSTATINWEIDYPLGVQMQRAALNTVMGLGVVFLCLLFLTWLIGQLHIIPDMIEKRTKKEEPAPAAPVQAAAPAPAAVAAEEDLTDDLELVAVITAAIAASGTTSGDGFTVRTIKKANKRNWQRA